ncbi:hypothetical protein OFC55_33685, partial [Escherichia coli]|nr:hypothetical protein [Escherichia coli]
MSAPLQPCRGAARQHHRQGQPHGMRGVAMRDGHPHALLPPRLVRSLLISVVPLSSAMYVVYSAMAVRESSHCYPVGTLGTTP